jgi:hypothetical protein
MVVRVYTADVDAQGRPDDLIATGVVVRNVQDD